MSSFYRQQLEDWLRTLDVKARVVFDVGGKQNPVKGRTKSWEVSDYKILDIPDHDIQLTNYNYPVPPRADVIFCLEVFEYLINPLAALKNICRMLEDHGKGYISVPLVYPVHNEVEFDSLRYTENGFKRLCEAVGLEARVLIYREDRSGLLESFYKSDGMHPAKGLEHSVTGYIFEVTK